MIAEMVRVSNEFIETMAQVVIGQLDAIEISGSLERQLFPKGLASIIVPSYNHEQYIIAALTSIADQDYRHKQVILVDDGSTDATFEVAVNYLNTTELEYVAVKKRNQGGPQISINQALLLTVSEWVCILASDDVFAGNKLSTQIAVGEQWQADIVIGHAGQMGRDGTVERRASEWQKWYSGIRGALAESASLRRLLFNEHYSVPYLGWMIRRRAFASVGLLDPSIYTEDFDFSLRMASERLTIAVSEGTMGWHRSTRDKLEIDRIDRATRSFKRALRKNDAKLGEYMEACSVVHINAAALKFALGYGFSWVQDIILGFAHAPIVACRHTWARVIGRIRTKS
jgi:glycosyltransferase involved in cell wall biosynthesis